MILDWQAGKAKASRYSVFSARTGECLDGEHIFYADDEAGFYRHHLTNEAGQQYLWDLRTKERLTNKDTPMTDTPSAFVEVAWERVDRAIVFRPKKTVEATRS